MVCLVLRYQVDVGIGDAQHQELIQEADHHQLFARPQSNPLLDPQGAGGATLQASCQPVTIAVGRLKRGMRKVSLRSFGLAWALAWLKAASLKGRRRVGWAVG